MKKWIKIVCCILPVMILSLSFVFIAAYQNNNKHENMQAAWVDSGDPRPATSTGATSATKNEKGGAIFLEENTTYTMSGGTIKGKSKKYGGAVYISKNATFTMNGGTITGCNAKYGGAIYVAAGGHCVIKGGTIKGNSAEVAPAIYVEEGGTLTTDTGSLVDDNTYEKWFTIEIAGSGLMGGTHNETPSTVSLNYVYFGSYPQTYVGDSMNSTLESWYKGKSVEKTYTIRDKVWNAYRYTDGELYVRGQSNPYSTSSVTYKNGTAVKGIGTYCWFKVEPIKWFVLNKNGNDYELFSEIVLTGYIYFNSTSSGTGVNLWKNSYIRDWCNDEFYNTAFTENEQKHIKTTTVGNNVTNNYTNATSDQSGIASQDHIYLKSYYDVSTTPFGSEKYAPSRMCSASDFAFSNYAYFGASSSYTSFYRENGVGNTSYWLRSAGSGASSACYVNINGIRNDISVTDASNGVRPAMHVAG